MYVSIPRYRHKRHNLAILHHLSLIAAFQLCSTRLPPNHGLELHRSQLTLGVAQPAIVGDAGEVGLGNVNARVEVLPTPAPYLVRASPK